MIQNLILIVLLFMLSGCVSQAPEKMTEQPLQQPLPESTKMVKTSVAQYEKPEEFKKPTPTTTFQPVAGKFPVITENNASRLVEIKSINLEYPGSIYWLPDDETIGSITFSDLVLINTVTAKEIKRVKKPETVTFLDFSPAKKWIATTTDRNTLKIVDLDGNVVTSINPQGGFGSATFSTDGEVIWLTSMEIFEATGYNTETGKKISACDQFETSAPVYSAFPSPGGKWLVWIARATIQLNDINTCENAAHIGHEDFIISHAFSPDESLLATSTGGTLDGEFLPLVFLWDAKTGSQIEIFPLDDSPAQGLAFSPSGNLLASTGAGISLFNISSGQKIVDLFPPDQRFTSVTFSPDGTSLVVTDEKSIRIFAVKP